MKRLFAIMGLCFTSICCADVIIEKAYRLFEEGRFNDALKLCDFTDEPDYIIMRIFCYNALDYWESQNLEERKLMRMLKEECLSKAYEEFSVRYEASLERTP